MPKPNWSDRAHDYLLQRFPGPGAQATPSDVSIAYLNGAIDALQHCHYEDAAAFARFKAATLPPAPAVATDGSQIAFGRAASELLAGGGAPARELEPLRCGAYKDEMPS